MLRVKMQRQGIKNRPVFRIVVIDARKLFSRNMKVLGFISPINHVGNIKEKELELALSKGAKITSNLFYRMKKFFPQLRIDPKYMV